MPGVRRARFPSRSLNYSNRNLSRCGTEPSTTITLQQGKYELDLSVKPTAGGKSGVAVAWIGEPSCGDSEEAQTIRVECRRSLHEKSRPDCPEPIRVGLGSSVTGYINLYQAHALHVRELDAGSAMIDNGAACEAGTEEGPPDAVAVQRGCVLRRGPRWPRETC